MRSSLVRRLDAATLDADRSAVGGSRARADEVGDEVGDFIGGGQALGSEADRPWAKNSSMASSRLVAVSEAMPAIVPPKSSVAGGLYTSSLAATLCD